MSYHNDVSDQFVDPETDLSTDLMEIVIWLARTYGDNEPIFPETPHGIRMRATWRLLFGQQRFTFGEWVQCGECEQWHVRNAEDPAIKRLDIASDLLRSVLVSGTSPSPEWRDIANAFLQMTDGQGED